MTRFGTFVAALAVALSMVACSQTDSGVTTKVKAKFAQDDLVKAHEINVTTSEGIVTLTGEVDTMEARQQAVRLARGTEGVTSVVDELRVDAAATTGDLGDDIERGVRKTGDAIKEGAEDVADAAKKAGTATRDAVTDDDRDSDNDGK